MNRAGESDVQNYLKKIRNSKFDSEIEAGIINSIHVFDNDYATRHGFQFQEKSYLNVAYLAELLKKSQTIPAYDILYSSSTTSTQTMTYKHFESYKNPLIYVADTQTRGRGNEFFSKIS